MLLIISLLIPPFLFGAPATNGDGYMKGYIEPVLYFSVTAFDPQLYNFLSNAELQPNGSGVEVGAWSLRVENPPIGDTLFEVSYTYDSLKAEGFDDSITFSLLEKTDDNATVVEKLSGGSTSVIISSIPTLNKVSRTLSARLTADGALSALNATSRDDFRSNIRVVLSIE